MYEPHRGKWLSLIAGAILLFGCAGPVGPRCRPRVAYAPWDAPRAPADAALTSGREADGPGDALIAFYQRRMRAPELPGAGCRFRPSCSAFAREAVRRYSLLGFVLIVDRMFVREHPFMDASYLPYCPRDGERGQEAVSDPVP